MKIKHQIILFTALFALISCEKTIEFKGEVTAPMLVISSFITPDSTIKAYVSKTRFFLDKGYIHEKVSNADFSLFVNGIAKGKLTPGGDGFYYSDYKPLVGEEIKYEVRASGLASVTGETKIPVQNIILNVDTSSVKQRDYLIYETGYNQGIASDTVGETTLKKISFRLKFTDNGDEKNYYRLLVIRQSHFEYRTTETYLSHFEDIVFGEKQTGSDVGYLFESSENNYTYDTFSDDIFNGKSYNLKFSDIITLEYKDYNSPGRSYEKEIRTIYFIYLQQISPDYYFYAKSSVAARSTDGNPFVEPVQIHSNIRNGVGLLGSYTSSPAYVIDVNN